MKRNRFRCRIFPAAIMALLLLDAGFAHTQDSLDSGAIRADGFPDEIAAMRALEQEESPENRERLARIRFVRALDLADYARKNGDRDARSLAVAYARTTTDLAPGRADNWFLLGRLYLELENDPRAAIMAIDALKKAIGLDPGMTKARMLLGQVYLETRRYDSALGEFETALRDDARLVNASVISTMIMTYGLLDRPTQGERFFRDMLTRLPDSAPLRLALAVMLHHGRNDTGAAKELNAVIQDKTASPADKSHAASLLQAFEIERKTWTAP